MPSVRERFKTFHDFARADLRTIYGARLDTAVRLEVNTPATGFFINNGKGQFAFEALPSEAQVAPVMGTSVTHLDGDGQPDIVLAQNFFPNQRETGRMSGGLSLVIIRKADGSLLPLPPKVSGIAIHGDARALATPDLNGDRRPDLLFAQNAATPRFYLNSASDDFFAFSVVGTPGNRSAIGARLVFEHANGRREARDISAGGGYLTQQPARLFHSSPSENPLRKVMIVWPDGSQSHATIPLTPGPVTLRR